MPEDYNLAFVNPYNDKLRERNYLLENMDIITHNPQLLGGGRVRERPLSGNNGAYPMDKDRLMELTAMGGKFNVTKFLRPTMRALNSKQGRSIVQPLEKALTARAVKAIEGGKIHGGINRYKKASKWLGFSTKALSSGLDLASRAKALSGYGELEDARMVVRRGKRLAKDPLVQEVIARVRKAPVVKRVEKKVEKIMGGGRAARAAIVKKVMDKQKLGMIAASKYVKANGLY
jgi:hypothetical protein